MARDCPEIIRPRPPLFRLAQIQANPQVNLVQPQVAAITRAQARTQPEEEPQENKHQAVCRELKKESVQITKGLRKRPPSQDDATLEKTNPGQMKWIKKVNSEPQFQESSDQAEDNNN